MARSRRAALAALFLAVPLAAGAADAPKAPAARPTNIPGGHYVLDNRHSTLIARVMHLGVSLYTIRFDTLTASFDYDPAHPEATHLQATVDPASLDVGASYSKTFAREFLKDDKFPTATFVSTGLTPTAPGRAIMSGDLTLMGVTKPVSFDVLLVGAGHEPLPFPFGQNAAGFEATAEIHRSDFGSKYLSGLVGDEVTLQIDAEFDRK